MLDTLITLVVGFALGWVVHILYCRATGRPDGTVPDTGPRIVVNVPSDFKPIPPMPATQLEGARAHLWYATFTKACEEYYPDSAADVADQAVSSVFGD